VIGDEGAAAVDTGSEGFDGSGGDGDSVEATGLADAPANDNASDAPAPKYKVRRGGKEEEYDADTLAKMLSDEHEWEFRGPKGQPVKRKWQELERDVQLSAGAMEAMKRAKTREQQIEQQLAWAKENDDNRVAFLEQFLGVEDAEQFALGIAKKLYDRQIEMQRLSQENPMEHQRRIEQIALQKFQRKQQWESRQREHQQQQQARQAEVQKLDSELRQQLESVGVQATPHNLARAANIYRQHRELDMDLPIDQIAALTRKEIEGEVLGYFDKQGPNVFKLLGDKRRAFLRDLELKAVEAAKKQQRTEQRAKPKPASESNGGSQSKQAADINSLLRRGGSGLA